MSARAGTADPPAARPVVHPAALRNGARAPALTFDRGTRMHADLDIYGAVDAALLVPDVQRGRAGAP